MTRTELQDRNKKFAIAVIRLVQQLPHDRIFDGLVRQIVRSATSIGANYRAACRGKSTADFINDSSNASAYNALIKEGNELLAIYVASIKTTRNNKS